MSEFNPGAVIARGSPLWPADQMRPDWLRDDARVMMRGSVTGWWYGDPDCTNVAFFGEEVNGDADDAIRLDASDIVYRCFAHNEAHPGEAPMWPWYGGELPSDLDERGHMLFGDGTTGFAIDMARLSRTHCIIGYQRLPATSIGEKHGWKCNNCQTVFTSEQDERREGDDNGGPTCPGCKAHGQYTYPYRLHHGDPAEEGTATTLLDDAKPGFNERQARRYAELAGGVFMPWMTASEADDWVARYVPANYQEIGFGVLDTLGIVRPDPTPLEIASAEYPDAAPSGQGRPTSQ